MDESRKNYIREQAEIINQASEKYQLIHAMFALEKIFKDRRQAEYTQEYNALREKLINTTDFEEKKKINEQVKNLQVEGSRRIKILVEYIPQMKGNCARIVKTKGNVFMIYLPEEMKNIRDEDGTINFELLKNLRHLMAHELGHITLHSGSLDSMAVYQMEEKEEEAEYFAQQLIELRKQRNEEIHKNGNYQKI